MPDTLTAKIIAIIAKASKKDATLITPESKFEDLGMDSLDGLTVISALEEEFSVSIPNEEAVRIRDVHQAVESLTKLIEQTSGGTRAATGS
jgi:acyl carrier protein